MDDSLIILEDYEAPERNGNGRDYGDENVMIIDEIPDIPDLPEAGNEETKQPHPRKEYVVVEKPKENGKNVEGMQTNTRGD